MNRPIESTMIDPQSYPLSQPLRLPNGSELRNRLAKAAMSETLASYDNRPTPELVELYRRWATSGIALRITGNVMIDRRALGEPGNVVIEDEADLPILQQWARAATDSGRAVAHVEVSMPKSRAPSSTSDHGFPAGGAL